MLIPEKYKKYTAIPKDCPKYDKSNPDYRCSVIYDRSNYRINTAKTEAQKNTVEISVICKLINDFLKELNIVSKCIFIDNLDILMTLNYEHIKRLYGLTNQSDIVWLRFTSDGFLGTVGSSNDINFDYSHNSGRIIKDIGKEWNKYRITIIPIPSITKREERLLIERMIGNYLLDNNIPILDRYSHCLGD
jgi:hypothetical protein